MVQDVLSGDRKNQVIAVHCFGVADDRTQASARGLLRAGAAAGYDYLQKLGIDLFEMALFRENTNKPIRPAATIKNVLGSGVRTTYS